jgi:hypothetical protein
MLTTFLSTALLNVLERELVNHEPDVQAAIIAEIDKILALLSQKIKDKAGAQENG